MKVRVRFVTAERNYRRLVATLKENGEVVPRVKARKYEGSHKRGSLVLEGSLNSVRKYAYLLGGTYL